MRDIYFRKHSLNTQDSFIQYGQSEDYEWWDVFLEPGVTRTPVIGGFPLNHTDFYNSPPTHTTVNLNQWYKF
jgi:hypothetical protein